MTDELGPESYQRWRRSPLGAITESLEQRVIASLLPTVRGASVLDAGCGDGTYAIRTAAEGAVVAALDLSFPMLAAARQRAKVSHATVLWCQGDVQSLPFADESFDVVFAVTVLCSVPSPARAVAELARVLRPGGALLIGELGRWSLWAAMRRLRALLGVRFWNGAHFWTFGELKKLLSQSDLACTETRAAIYYPPCSLAARVLGRLESGLSVLGSFGAAFLAVRAEKRCIAGRCPANHNSSRHNSSRDATFPYSC